MEDFRGPLVLFPMEDFLFHPLLNARRLALLPLLSAWTRSRIKSVVSGGNFEGCFSTFGSLRFWFLGLLFLNSAPSSFLPRPWAEDLRKDSGPVAVGPLTPEWDRPWEFRFA